MPRSLYPSLEAFESVGGHLKYCDVFTILCDILSTTLTVRIPKDLKDEMVKIDVNWSEVVRKAVEEKLMGEKASWAMKVMDEISSKSKPKKPAEQLVREMRDARWRKA